MLPQAALQPLIDIPHWLVWKYETSPAGKPTKVPYQARNPARKALTNDPTTWATYDEACAVVQGFTGVGFVLTESPITAFDIDKCVDPTTGEIHTWARELVGRTNSYTEITVSGTGLRIIGFGSGPYTLRKLPVVDGVSCELYRNCPKYIAMTGNQLGDRKLINIDAAIDATLEELDTQPAASGGTAPPLEDNSDDKLWETIRTGGDFPDRSRGVWFCCNEMLRRGYSNNAILIQLMDRSNKISEHIYDQGDPNEYAKRQILEARKKLDFARGTKPPHKPLNTLANIRVALVKLNVTLRYDLFADHALMYGLPDLGPVLDDAAMTRLRLTIESRWRFLPGKDIFYDVVGDMARLNSFHPVREYLDGLSWDGVPRLDKWLTTYGGAEDTKYTNAVGSLLCIAAVRRVRQPGCKFDEMVVLESPTQGTEKSTTLATLAVYPSWFSDDLPLNIKGKEVIEALRGRWIMEAAELSGMSKSTIEHLKAFLSRQVDRARMAWGHIPAEVPRECVIVGTTNHEVYLKDTTGNRRYWPVRVKSSSWKI